MALEGNDETALLAPYEDNLKVRRDERVGDDADDGTTEESGHEC